MGCGTRETEERKGNIVRPFMAEKAAMMNSSKLVHQRDQHPRIPLEFRRLVRTNHVAQVTGDQWFSLPLAGGGEGEGGRDRWFGA
jgi:hypothetical protein